MKLPIGIPYPPMEAAPAAQIPEGEGWQYEPKWDGFRCLAFRNGEEVELQSKAGKPLTRYFPDLVAALKALKAKQFVLDGEIIIPVDGEPSFDELLQRIHPSASRVKLLANQYPCLFVVFDLLVNERGKALVNQPLERRRRELERWAAKLSSVRGIALSPATPGACKRSRTAARRIVLSADSVTEAIASWWGLCYRDCTMMRAFWITSDLLRRSRRTNARRSRAS